MSSRTSRLFLAGLFSAIVFLYGTAQGQEKRDILKDAAERQKLELQRLQTEFKDANEKATNLLKTDPAEALSLLTGVQDKIAGNTDIPEANRNEMLRSLKLRISAIGERVASQTTPIPNTIGPARAKEAQLKKDEAAREQKEMLDKFRNSAAFRKTQDTYLREQKEQGYLGLMLENDKASIPPSGDISFPKNWAEISKKRQQLNLTEAEKKIMKALSTPIDIDKKDSTLEEIIGYIQDKTGVTIIVPKSILDEKAITYQTPVSVSLKGVTVRTVLKKTLADVGLTYVIDKGVIQATTEERAKLTLSTRTYYIGDLIGLIAPPNGYLNNRTSMMLAINDIIGVVTGTVEPQSWWINGGPGTIAFDPRTMSLIVRQTAEIHYMFGIGMR